MPLSNPAPLPRNLLVSLGQAHGLLLCLDYDGTLAEITAEPAIAWPYRGVRVQLQRLISSHSKRIAVAIITGRMLSDLKRLLGLEAGIFFSGVHGLERDEPFTEPHFAVDALACASELAAARRWLTDNVPAGRGFRIEDKRVALGLHYRGAEAIEAAALCDRFAGFVARAAPQLKLVRLKMLAEVMPRIASKAHAVRSLKKRVPASYVAIYFGDDTTDEDAFAALDKNDVGILVGADRLSHATYRVDGPAAVVDELRALAGADAPAPFLSVVR